VWVGSVNLYGWATNSVGMNCPNSLRNDIVDAKDLHDREFKALTRNFYLMRSALRYFSVKQGLSFTSSKVADNFPVTVSTAGSCLKVMEEIGVVESRNSSRKRFMPQKCDLDKMERAGEILRENYEIREFNPEKDDDRNPEKVKQTEQER